MTCAAKTSHTDTNITLKTMGCSVIKALNRAIISCADVFMPLVNVTKHSVQCCKRESSNISLLPELTNCYPILLNSSYELKWFWCICGLTERCWYSDAFFKNIGPTPLKGTLWRAPSESRDRQKSSNHFGHFQFFSKVIKYVFERVVWLFSQFWHEYLISLAPCWWAKPGDDRPNEQPQSTL